MNPTECNAINEKINFYKDKSISLLTKHKKEEIIAPILEEAFGCQVKLAVGFDTDQLGTFTRETSRVDNQLDTARKKARIGMELMGSSVGIASEGSFGPDPFTGFIPWNRELVILIDNDLKIEIVGQAQGPGTHQQLLTSDWQEAAEFATKIGFPAQQLVARPENEDDLRIRKDINEWKQFEYIFASLSAVTAAGKVFIETDGRAHGNPARRTMIAKASQDLIAKMQSFCPSCGLPGFWINERIPGLPCMHCGRPTRVMHAEVWLCNKCRAHEKREASDEWADPMFCDYCNP